MSYVRASNSTWSTCGPHRRQADGHTPLTLRCLKRCLIGCGSDAATRGGGACCSEDSVSLTCVSSRKSSGRFSPFTFILRRTTKTCCGWSITRRRTLWPDPCSLRTSKTRSSTLLIRLCMGLRLPSLLQMTIFNTIFVMNIAKFWLFVDKISQHYSHKGEILISSLSSTKYHWETALKIHTHTLT